MKNVIMITAVPLMEESSGVKHKVVSQAKAFAQLGLNVNCIGYGQKNEIILQTYTPDKPDVLTRIIGEYRNGHFKRISFWRCVEKHAQQNKYDLAFIRYPIFDWSVFQALQSVRKSCRTVVMEIPSYPLVFRGTGLVKKLQFEIDSLLQNKCGQYLDKVLYIGNHCDTIFDRPSEQIANGLPDSIFQIPQTGYQLKGNTIHMICVSNMYKVHGYDRLIKGIGNYYEKKTDREYDFTVTMVGDGPCRAEYEQLAKEKGIEDKVSFVGALYGEKLTRIYNDATIGIGGLGLHREGQQEASSLKTKEYMIRGLPFVYAGKEIGLETSFRYALQVENTDKDIDIEAVASFVSSIKKNDRNDVMRQMKEYAIKHYDWKTILQQACGVNIID